MWVYLVGLCLVPVVICEDVDQRKSMSLSPLDTPAEATPLSLSLNNGLDHRPLFEPGSTVQNNLQSPFPEIALPDLSKYIPKPAVPVPDGSVSNVNYNVPAYPVVPKATPYNLNLPPNYVPGYNKYSPVSPTTSGPILLNTRYPGNGVQQSILAVPYSPPQKPIHCDNSDILIKIWMILSNLLETGTTSTANTYVDRIKYALIMIKKYLEETNTNGQNNDLTWRLVLLESELQKENDINSQQPINIYPPSFPFQNDIAQKLQFQYEIPTNLKPKCREAFMKLIHWAQEAYANLIKSPDCGYSDVGSSLNFNGNINSVTVPYDVTRNSYFQIPYSYYHGLNQNLQNVSPYSFGQINQQPYNAATNSYFQYSSTFPVISQLNQDQPNTISNPSLQTLTALYNPPTDELLKNGYYSAASIYQTSDIQNPLTNPGQLNKPENIVPSYAHPPPNLFQRERPLNSPYSALTPQVPSGATAFAGNNLSPPLPFHANFATNLQHMTGIANKLLAENIHQHVNPYGTPVVSTSHLIPPKVDATELPSAFNVQTNQQLDAAAIQRYMQSIPISNGHYENIQKYLNSQYGQTHWNTPQQYGAYGQMNYQTYPQMNHANEPLTEMKENTFDLTRNSGLSQNLYQTTLPSQVLPTIDWNGIANDSKLNPGNTLNGDVELTYALKRPKPENQPLYFVKYRLPYDVFMQNVKSLLSSRAGKPDLSKDLVLKSNATEIPHDLASYPKEEVRDLVVRDGDLIKARYIEANRTNDNSSSAADSINELLSKAINAESNLNALNSDHKVANDFTRPYGYNMDNPYQNGIGQPGFQNPVNSNQYQPGGYQTGNPLQRGPNGYGLPYPSGFNGLPQTVAVNPYNPVNPGF